MVVWQAAEWLSTSGCEGSFDGMSRASWDCVLRYVTDLLYKKPLFAVCKGSLVARQSQRLGCWSAGKAGV